MLGPWIRDIVACCSPVSFRFNIARTAFDLSSCSESANSLSKEGAPAQLAPSQGPRHKCLHHKGPRLGQHCWGARDGLIARMNPYSGSSSLAQVSAAVHVLQHGAQADVLSALVLLQVLRVSAFSIGIVWGSTKLAYLKVISYICAAPRKWAVS